MNSSAIMFLVALASIVALGVIGHRGIPDWLVIGASGTDQVAPGHFAPAPPTERRLSYPMVVLETEDFSVEAFASIEVTGLVLSSARYFSDRLAPIAPVDLVLGWGPMSERGMFSSLWVSQSGRFYLWRTHGSGPITASEVIDHSSNMHIIPASETVRSALLKVEKGDIVRLVGSVVDIEGPDGWSLRSARNQQDRRAGASKALMVTLLEVTGRMDPI